MNHNYVNILTHKNGQEMAIIDSYGNTNSSNVSIKASGVTHLEARSYPSGNVLTVHPNADDGLFKINGNLPSGHYLLFRKSDQTMANVTLSSKLTLTSNGFLDTIFGNLSAGNITVTTTSGDVYNSVTELEFNDQVGIDAIETVPGRVKVEFGNNVYIENIFANNITANTGYITDGHFNNVYTNVLTDDGAFEAIQLTTKELNATGPQNPPPIPNTFLPGEGAVIKLSGAGAGQYIPGGPVGFPDAIQPILPSRPATLIGGPTPTISYPPVPEGVGVESIPPGPHIYNTTPVKSGLYFYGDAGGPNPYPSGGGFTPMRWYAGNPNKLSNPIEAQRNLHFSETNLNVDGKVDIPTAAFPSRYSGPIQPAYYYQSNIYEMRNYTGPNVFSESWIHISPYIAPGTDDPPIFEWNWKVHDDYNIDTLPWSYRSNINEVNKISFAINRQSGETSIKWLTDYTGVSNLPRSSKYLDPSFYTFAHTPYTGAVQLRHIPAVPYVNNIAESIVGSGLYGMTRFEQFGRCPWQTDGTKMYFLLAESADSGFVTPGRPSYRARDTFGAGDNYFTGGISTNSPVAAGDWIGARANEVTDTVFRLYPFNWATGGIIYEDRNWAEICLDQSNTLSIKVQENLSNVLGDNVLATRFLANAETVIVGGDDIAIHDIDIKTHHGSAFKIDGTALSVGNRQYDQSNGVLSFDMSYYYGNILHGDVNGIEINNGSSLNVSFYSNTFATDPIISIDGSDVGYGNTYFTIRHIEGTDAAPFLTLENEGHVSSGPRSRARFNEDGDINVWYDFVTTRGTSSSKLRMTQTGYFIGLDSTSSNTTYIHYSHCENQPGRRYFQVWSKGAKYQIGRRTKLQENALLNIDARKIQYFADDGVAQPESINIMSTTSNTIVALSFNADANVLAANNFVHVNPNSDANMGFKVSTSNVSDALIVGSEKAIDSVKLGVPVVGVQDTSANHLSADYATPYGIVYSTNEETYCYYNSTATELTCFAKKGEVCLNQYDTYNNIYTWQGTSERGCMAYANVETTNLGTVANKPDAEVADDTERIHTAVVHTPMFLSSMLNTVRYTAWLRFPANNLGVDDIDGETAPSGSGGARLWQYEGENNTLSADKRLVFDRMFSYTDGSYSGFDFNEGIIGYLPEGNILVNGVTRQFNFRRQYAPLDGWITGVQLKHPGFVELQQGDTSWNGANSQFKGFAALYLGLNDSESTVANIRNPGNVLRYLKKWQFTSNSDTEKITLEGIENIQLPSEEWVFVAKGDPLPYVHFTYFAGTEDARIRMLSFDWSVTQTSDAFGRWWSADVFFTYKPPDLLNRYRGDQRWDLTNVPTS